MKELLLDLSSDYYILIDQTSIVEQLNLAKSIYI